MHCRPPALTGLQKSGQKIACTTLLLIILSTDGKSHKEFLQEAIERSSPGNARVLTNLFGGLELGMDLGMGGAQAVISVGGAATRCQHQSPCFDRQCQLCYDPLLRYVLLTGCQREFWIHAIICDGFIYNDYLFIYLI